MNFIRLDRDEIIRINIPFDFILLIYLSRLAQCYCMYLALTRRAWMLLSFVPPIQELNLRAIIRISSGMSLCVRV